MSSVWHRLISLFDAEEALLRYTLGELGKSSHSMLFCTYVGGICSMLPDALLCVCAQILLRTEAAPKYGGKIHALQSQLFNRGWNNS
jgi:hypothetical protein